MSIASGSRVRWVYLEESTHGVTPGTPQTKVLRTTSRSINLTKNILQTAEVRSDRQKKDVRHGFNKIEASPGFELSVGAYDDFFAALFGGTWAAVNVAATPNLGANSSQQFTRATGSFVTDGFRAGDLIVTTGFSVSGNNGTFTVLTVAATLLTVLETIATESSGSGKTLQLKGKRLDPGTTLTTMVVERQFLDLAQYQVFNGVIPNTASLDIKPEAMIGGTFNLIGMSGGTFSGSPLTATPTAAATNAPLAAFDGTLVEAGAVIGVVTGLSLNIDNGRSVVPVVGSKYSPDVFDGEFVVTGNMMAFFQNATLFNKFVNETASSIYLRMNDVNGTDFIHVVLPNIKYTGAMIDPPQTGPVSINMPFQALVDSTSLMSMSIQRSNT